MKVISYAVLWAAVYWAQASVSARDAGAPLLAVPNGDPAASIKLNTQADEPYVPSLVQVVKAGPSPAASAKTHLGLPAGVTHTAESHVMYDNSKPYAGPIPASLPFTGSPRPQPRGASAKSGTTLQLRIGFTNDIHAHEDEFNFIGSDCIRQDFTDGTCYGGMARIKTVFDALRAGHRDTLIFDAGDQFQGTLFYSYYKGNSTSRFINGLGYDAMTIGNHEFDDGPEHLARFFSQLNFPVVCSNLDLTASPHLNQWVKPYVIYPEYNLAILGFVTVNTKFISKPGDNVKFLDPATQVNKYIKELRAKGIQRFIALSHNGYKQDMEVALKTEGQLAVIVGGHSHTYLSPDPHDPDSKGPYPTKVGINGRSTYIVQAKKFGEYVGYLDLEITEDGQAAWLAGQPIHMTTQIPKDPYFAKQVSLWREPFDRTGGYAISQLPFDLPQQPCKTGECLLGNMVTDAMLEVGRRNHPEATIALMNSDGMRMGMRLGNVTINSLVNVLPNESYLVYLKMTGKEIRDVLVGAVTEINQVDQNPVTVFIQYSGLQMEFDPTAKTVKQVYVRASGGQSVTPLQQLAAGAGTYSAGPSSPSSSSAPDSNGSGNGEWVPLDEGASYNVISTDFITEGGDHLFATPAPSTRITKMYNMLYEYVKTRPKLEPVLDGRMISTAA
ncbi:hypothetical protein IWQ60_008323 [Tieghemiomyces parasiticus]|uniref:5'-nucleotidase n=1 Tax=Tieghemiomyces parasiticus TaxID=78921 RepID=A0A9W8DRM7_9FUNG|nr:hypothetical protein IWQ60_008323 [Tieghemiomyces parasiticus]